MFHLLLIFIMGLLDKGETGKKENRKIFVLPILIIRRLLVSYVIASGYIIPISIEFSKLTYNVYNVSCKYLARN
jgi:hypothetical protein